jgi:hypothetical protein
MPATDNDFEETEEQSRRRNQQTALVGVGNWQRNVTTHTKTVESNAWWATSNGLHIDGWSSGSTSAALIQTEMFRVYTRSCRRELGA